MTENQSWDKLTTYTFILQPRKQRGSDFPQTIQPQSPTLRQKQSLKKLDTVVGFNHLPEVSYKKAVWLLKRAPDQSPQTVRVTSGL